MNTFLHLRMRSTWPALVTLLLCAIVRGADMSGGAYDIYLSDTASAGGTLAGGVYTLNGMVSLGDTYFNNNTLAPANHPTAFSAMAMSSSDILDGWTDATTGTPLPAGYLIRASHTSYAEIPTPVNNVPVADSTTFADGTGAKNVTQVGGANSYPFSGLAANYVVYFKIFPYCGSGLSIAYKTDGTVPEAYATTTPEPAGLACAGLLLALARRKTV